MIAIVGASGYIGRHLVASLRRDGQRVRVLSRTAVAPAAVSTAWAGVEIHQGDLQAPESLQGFLEPGCTVINLVYLWNAGEAVNLSVTRHLLDACRSAGVGRLIHCSTAAVVGRVSDDEITEATPCRPITEYGITKLKVEQAVLDAARGHFDAAILRPTSVFGPAGDPVKLLASEIVGGHPAKNWIKASLFGRRRMNLVPIANVVAAIRFLAERTAPLMGEVFIVSDDASPGNNFADVSRVLRATLRPGRAVLPRLPLPMGLLARILAAMGRNNVNPRCTFSSAKLECLGYTRATTFEAALAEYAEWYRATHVVPS